MRASRRRWSEAAEKAGQPTPRMFALSSVALGAEAIARQQRTADSYNRLPAYVAHFQRMGAQAGDVLVSAHGPANVACEALRG